MSAEIPSPPTLDEIREAFPDEDFSELTDKDVVVVKTADDLLEWMRQA